MPVSSSGTFGAVWAITSGGVSSTLGSGDRTFDSKGAATELRLDGSGGNKLQNGTAVEFGYNGAITWGRWMSGKSDVSPLTGDLAAMHYFAFTGTPVIPVVKAYTSFASTAPTVTSALGIVTTVGSSNAATGTLNVNFTGASGGTVGYALQVPVPGNTFTLVGTAAQSNTFGFAGTGVVTSALPVLGCTFSCPGALPGGYVVQGAVGGADASRAGLVYGFTSLLGKVTGAIVFKSP